MEGILNHIYIQINSTDCVIYYVNSTILTMYGIIKCIIKWLVIPETKMIYGLRSSSKAIITSIDHFEN